VSRCGVARVVQIHQEQIEVALAKAWITAWGDFTVSH